MLINFHKLLWSYLQRVPILLAMTVYIYIYIWCIERQCYMPVLAIGQSQISSRNLIQTHWKSLQYFIRRGVCLTSDQCVIQWHTVSLCNNIFVALTPQETKKYHDFSPKWPGSHQMTMWYGLRCLSDTVVICFGIVTRFGNCTNVWLWTNAKCCCLFQFFVYYFCFYYSSRTNLCVYGHLPCNVVL